jgi:aspartyl-tRNA(Asn)/glutamyl-tRNA(Gln) amidotransferase subunit B
MSVVTVVDWEPVIGLEVHAQLKTRTKMFCSCETSFGDPPNTHVCPVCLGLPGSMPVMNGTAFRLALKGAMALNCQIAHFTKADRKNYYYPDLPKNYQISQYDLPFATNGWLDITLEDGTPRRIGITRVHIEEDAGKLVHDESGAGGDSGVDLNRAGTPLIEIVSEPDLRSPAEARAYMEKLAQILLYLDVCDCNMQEGSLRCDANVSLRPRGQSTFNTRREIKNMNSFRFVEQAVVTELREQREIYETGGTIQQSTRLFDGQTGAIRTMRTKEDAHDYRYFPEPDLPPITLTDELIAEIRGELAELPEARRARYQKDWALSEYDAGVMTEHKELGDYFEHLVAAGIAPKSAANWIISDCQGLLKARGLAVETCGISPERMAGLLKLVETGSINRATAKEKVLPVMLESPRSADEIVKAQGLAQVSDESSIGATIDEVLAKSEKLVADYVGGKDATLNAIFGACMKAFHGKGNPTVIRPLLEQKLQSLRDRNGGG